MLRIVAFVYVAVCFTIAAWCALLAAESPVLWILAGSVAFAGIFVGGLLAADVRDR